MLRKSFLFTVSFLAMFLSLSPASSEDQIQKIDQEIEELQEIKRGYVSKALRHEDYAQRLQFEDRAYLETRRHILLAEENREKAKRVQEEIDQLEAKKQELILKKNK